MTADHQTCSYNSADRVIAYVTPSIDER